MASSRTSRVRWKHHGADLYWLRAKRKAARTTQGIVPKLSRVGHLWTPTNPDHLDYQAKETETVARSLRLAIQSLEVKGPDDFEGAFQDATQKRAGALLGAGGAFFAFHRKRIVDLAAKSRLPAIYNNNQYVETGGLMTYAEDRPSSIGAPPSTWIGF